MCRQARFKVGVFEVSLTLGVDGPGELYRPSLVGGSRLSYPLRIDLWVHPQPNERARAT